MTLPLPISSSSLSSADPTAEYPVARFLRDNLWACTDGTGNLYLVDAVQKGIIANHELLDDSGALLPFCLHAVSLQNDNCLCIVSAASTAPSTKGKDKASYQVMLVKIRLETSSGTQRLIPSVTLRGSDIPQYAFFRRDRCYVGATCRYRAKSNTSATVAEVVQPTTMDADAEIVDIPRAGQTSGPLENQNPPPPYSWTQDTDTVTLVFPLPSNTSAKNVKVVFIPTAISLDVLSSAEDTSSIPRLSSIKLWDTIDAYTSTWTWEKAGGDQGKYGVLALHLEKKHEGTRWTSAFKPASDGNAGVDARYLHVEETLDRSQLLQITEALEKYTSDQTSGAGSGMADFEQRSSLLGEEFDADVDGDERQSGKSLVFTVIEDIAAEAPEASSDKAEAADLLSVPFPADDADQGIVIKHDVDGLYFQLDDAENWKHASTYPALGFVLASKRDVVQIYHYKDKLCIGLETGSPVGMQGSQAGRSYSSMQSSKMNAYLYFPPPPGSKAKSAKQKVVGLADSNAGAVLGALAFERGDMLDIAVLCERELVVLQDVLR